MSLKEMTLKERITCLAKGRVTVGQITQIVEGKMVSFYVGKLAGTIVSDRDKNIRFDTEEAARQCAIDFRQHCQEKEALTQ